MKRYMRPLMAVTLTDTPEALATFTVAAIEAGRLVSIGAARPAKDYPHRLKVRFVLRTQTETV